MLGEKHFRAQSIMQYLAIYAILTHMLILLERILNLYFDQNSKKKKLSSYRLLAQSIARENYSSTSLPSHS